MSVLIDEGNALRALEPESVKHDANVTAVTAAYAPRFAAISAHRHEGIKLQRLDELSSCELDHLAAQWHAVAWSDAWPIETKRRMLRSVIQELSRTGTVTSVKNIIAGLGSAAVIVEWWQTKPQGTPHTFQIRITVNEIPGVDQAKLVEQITQSVDSTKPVRSQYTMTLIKKGGCSLAMVNAARVLTYARIGVLSGVSKVSVTATINNAARVLTYARIY